MEKRKLDKIFSKGETISGKDPKRYKKDVSGNVIYRYSYGKKSEMGWDIDHSKPKSKGGTDHLNNLQPLQWRENEVNKKNEYPYKKNKKK